jgi:hypothetical protein
MTPVQEAVIERLDAAVAIGTAGLALIVLLLAIIAVSALRSHA